MNGKKGDGIRGMQRLRTGFLLLVISCLLPGLCCLAKGGSKISVCELEQWHPNWGPIKMYIGRDGIRIVPEQFHVEVISKGPKWQIYAFNNADKTICDGNIEQFRRIGARMTLKGIRRGAPAGYHKQDKLKYMGHACMRLWGANDSYDYVQDLGCDNHVFEITSNFYQLYTAPGVIVASVRYKPRDVRLKTVSIKQTHVASNFFDTPTNYKKVESFQHVFLTNQKTKEFEELIDDLGVGKALKPK